MPVKRILGFLFISVWLNISWAGSAAQEQAEQWLKRMMQATQTLSYQGTFVYIKDQNAEVMRIVQSHGVNGKRQRMLALTGTPREVIVAEDGVMCQLPKQRLTFNKPKSNRSPFPISLPHDLTHLKRSYRFTMQGEDRVAGLPTRIIAILPRDELRFGYRLWLEQDSSMVLRSALVDTQGNILEQLMFTAIDINSEIDASLLMPLYLNKTAETQIEHPLYKPVLSSNWQVTKLPLGFDKIAHNRFPETSSTAPTEHMVFSDGLATVSVFLERLTTHNPLIEGPSAIGAMNAFSVVRAGYQVVGIGEVPPATVKQIATSIERKTDAQ